MVAQEEGVLSVFIGFIQLVGRLLSFLLQTSRHSHP